MIRELPVRNGAARATLVGLPHGTRSYRFQVVATTTLQACPASTGGSGSAELVSCGRSETSYVLVARTAAPYDVPAE